MMRTTVQLRLKSGLLMTNQNFDIVMITEIIDAAIPENRFERFENCNFAVTYNTTKKSGY